MKNQENKIAANKHLAELLGWSNIVEVGGASGFLARYRCYQDRDAAARAAIVKAVTHRLEKAR